MIFIHIFYSVTLFPSGKNIGAAKKISLSSLVDLKADLTIFDDSGFSKLLYSYNLTDIESIILPSTRSIGFNLNVKF